MIPILHQVTLYPRQRIIKPEGAKHSAVMASSATARAAVGAAKVVKPILSRDLDEAKRRVRELYRAWYREIPNTGMMDRCNGCKVIKPLLELQGRVSIEVQSNALRE